MKHNAPFSPIGSLSMASLDAINPPPRSSGLAGRILSSRLSVAEKRQILSSWASDQGAVAGSTTLRRLDDGVLVAVHDILNSLKTLDVTDPGARWQGPRKPAPRPSRRSQLGTLAALIRHGRKNDDDDDPPPCPAVIAPFPRLPPSGAEAHLEAA